MHLKTLILLLLILFLGLASSAREQKHKLLEDRKPFHFSQYIFMIVSIIITAIIRHITRVYELSISYSVISIFLGCIWGIGCLYSETVNQTAGLSFLFLDTMLQIYMPIMMFTTAFIIDAHAFIKAFPQIMLISLPVLMVTACFSGVLMRQVLDTNWSIADAILLGIISSCIYPIDVLRWLHETSIAIKYVSILLQGETLISTAITGTISNAITGWEQEWLVHWYQIVVLIVRSVFGGILLGMIFGGCGVVIMKIAYSKPKHLMILSIALAFTSYYFGMYITSSGAITCLVCGVMMGKECPTLTREIEDSLHSLWKMLSMTIHGFFYVSIGILVPIIFYDADLALNEYFVLFVTYLLTNIGRFISFFLFSPILSRIGYGMTFQTTVVCSWSGLTNPYAVFIVWRFINEDQSKKYQHFFLHVAGLYILLLIINGTFIPVLFRTIGLSKIPVSKQLNMNNCMNYIYETRARTVAILKMDRLLADANWPMVMIRTNLKHPYKKEEQFVETETEEEREDYFLGYKFTYCPDCRKNIEKEPTPKEMREMTKEAKIRLLKQKKTAYVRQYENGMISKEGVRIMLQAVEIAMDSEELTIELEGLLEMFSRERPCYTCTLRNLQAFSKTKDDVYRIPIKKIRVWCYKTSRTKVFRIGMQLLILANMVINTHLFEMETKYSEKFYFTLIANIFFSIAYLLELAIKILGYSWMFIIRDGVVNYLRNKWHFFEILTIVLTLSAVLLHIIFVSTKNIFFPFWGFQLTMNIVLYIRTCRNLAYLKLPQLFKKLAEVLMKLFQTEMERTKSLAYELGKNYIAGEDEILENLNQIIDNEKIKQKLREKTEEDKLTVSRRLGIAQMESPWVASIVKTKTAIRSVLNSLRDDITELKISGWLDDVEHKKLLNSLNEKYKNIHAIKAVVPSSPKEIFREVLFMNDDEELISFLYSQVCTRKYDPGNTVFDIGDTVEGIYILITGMLRVHYQPTKEIMEKLKETGALPVVDFVSSLTYAETMTDYVMPGNTVGELSSMTFRPYDGYLTAETHSEVFLLKVKAIRKAMEFDADPVGGLECRIWKSIAFRKAMVVLMNIPSYHSYTQEKIRYILERSFVPNLLNYKVFNVSDMMQDLLLIEGTVVDYNTRDLFVAPCYIPRAVQKLVLPQSSLMNLDSAIETKILIIPAKDYDEYQIMLQQEHTCQLVDDDSPMSLRQFIRNRKIKTAKVKKLSTSQHIKRASTGVVKLAQLNEKDESKTPSEQEKKNPGMKMLTSKSSLMHHKSKTKSRLF